MIKSLANLSLFLGVPVAALTAYGMLSYYQDLGNCVGSKGAAQDACLREFAKNMPEPTLEMAMATCFSAERFLMLYRADQSTRRRYPYSEDEVMAQYAKVCEA
ncbi:MAG: hypothetical protein JL55_17735 [Pseudomonas sp. BICA1-14]|uniref:hypothetical protein n=1 Tax=Stutzerimonas kunmingensis TaxID=1211807 RepID=UPI0005B31B00|nr:MULTISPECIES: hypothetical protein [Stutzerimonas stutzeri group]KJS76772.1 MAG: hypothetical protein JL55_17735 [[Pseudomonas] sp. BICA1-14]HBW09164.1 hypothetical protein [Pseudomonas sp.]